MLRMSSLAKPAKGLVLSSFVFGLLGLSACGGGGDGGSNDTTTAKIAAGDSISSAQGTDDSSQNASMLSERSNAQGGSYAVPVAPVSKQEAARFLTQASFGPTDFQINRVMTMGYRPWLNEQFSYTPTVGYKNYWETRDNAIKAKRPASGAHINELNHAFWANAINGHDQVRQRVALALSEIFVVSVQDGCGENNLKGVASYMDMLNERAFGLFRDLIESVALHPVMGCYLSHMKNQKEDMASGRVPDENFAREIMQLFSIGLVQLNADGSPKFGPNGQPLETYKAEDVAGLAKVFTGWSLDCPDWPSDHCYVWGTSLRGQSTPDRWTKPMKPYARFHSTSEKRFLGTVIPSQGTANPQGDLRIALDVISRHPNVGPFLGKQLIQRLVTSNPSPGYIQRVSQAYTSSGGSLQAMVATILTDPEARDTQAALKDPNYGKVREPLLRFSAVLRAYGAKSDTGSYLMWTTNDVTNLAQAPLQAPSVFNYFRPAYSPPSSATSQAKLVSPEMQILHETSLTGFVNFMRDGLRYGWGFQGFDNTGTSPDIKLEYQRNAQSSVLTLAKTPAALVEDTNQRLLNGTMSPALKAEILAAVTSINFESRLNPTGAAAETAWRRVMTAILLTTASPEFLVQK